MENQYQVKLVRDAVHEDMNAVNSSINQSYTHCHEKIKQPILSFLLCTFYMNNKTLSYIES